MKLRAKANGMVIDLPEADAAAYLSTGLYDVVDESPPVPPVTPPKVPRAKKVKAT